MSFPQTVEIRNHSSFQPATQTAYFTPSPKTSSLRPLSLTSCDLHELPYQPQHPLLPEILQLQTNLTNPQDFLSLENFNTLLNQVLHYCLKIECAADSPLIVEKELINFIQTSISILCCSFTQNLQLEALYIPLKNFWKKVIKDWKERSEGLSETFNNTLNHSLSKISFSNYVLMEELLTVYSRSPLFAKEPIDHQLIRREFWQKNWLGVCRQFDKSISKMLHADLYELWIIAEIELFPNWKTLSFKQACTQLNSFRSYSLVIARKEVDDQLINDLINLILEKEPGSFTPSSFYAPNRSKPALAIATCYFTLKRGYQPIEKISWHLLKEWCEAVLKWNDPLSRRKTIFNSEPVRLVSQPVENGSYRPANASNFYPHSTSSIPPHSLAPNNLPHENSKVQMNSSRSFGGQSFSQDSFHWSKSNNSSF